MCPSIAPVPVVCLQNSQCNNIVAVGYETVSGCQNACMANGANVFQYLIGPNAENPCSCAASPDNCVSQTFSSSTVIFANDWEVYC